jgi:GMP synthase-like glutamine amidotransferase
MPPDEPRARVAASLRVAAIGDAGDDDAGHVGERLFELGATWRSVDRADTAAVAGAGEAADVLLLLGSDRSVYEPRQRAVVEAEFAAVADAERRGVAVFAICYGAQLVAAHLGAVVRPAKVPEVGWLVLDTDDASRCGRGPWFELHCDGFSPPPSAATIARSAAHPQAFVRGRTFACQFHPEVTAAVARRWLTEGARRWSKAGIDVEALIAETDACEARARESAHRLVDSFLDGVAGAPPAAPPDR